MAQDRLHETTPGSGNPVVVETGPTHRPGLLTRAMCGVAAHLGMGYYTALNGDAWSPDHPDLDPAEASRRLDDFERDCANRGLSNWRGLAESLGYTLEEWPGSK